MLQAAFLLLIKLTAPKKKNKNEGFSHHRCPQAPVDRRCDHIDGQGGVFGPPDNRLRVFTAALGSESERGADFE